ncbi:MAG: DUF2254 domain-containing protein [Gammaproteobacteria bacterium]|nr:DUF2254 domain-containing protein [Gammaproteobacteria bacterium]MBU2477872.1 DUF2254 domain-containing protein [Gammaproteobacteria bacterium]
MCLLSIAAAFLASAADLTQIGRFIPNIESKSIVTLLTIISSSMLVIATFAVGSMVSAYASASSTATPRSFPLVIADDISQNALSAFIGSFIFSIVALIALENGYYEKAGRFTLFIMTLAIFAIVIATFVRWVDRVARLGRMGSTIDKVEAATARSLRQRRCVPNLGGSAKVTHHGEIKPLYTECIGYVQRIDAMRLQECAEALQLQVEVAVLPGAFIAPGSVLAYVSADMGSLTDITMDKVVAAFTISDDRTFDEDPRFGLIVLSEIASRALSPGINDPGTAIDVIGTLVRIFAIWTSPVKEEDMHHSDCDRISIPGLSLDDLFDDAFTPIARDGASTIEVVVRLQKAFKSLGTLPDEQMRKVAHQHARMALARAELALNFPKDIEDARKAAAYSATA